MEKEQEQEDEEKRKRKKSGKGGRGRSGEEKKGRGRGRGEEEEEEAKEEEEKEEDDQEGLRWLDSSRRKFHSRGKCPACVCFHQFLQLLGHLSQVRNDWLLEPVLSTIPYPPKTLTLSIPNTPCMAYLPTLGWFGAVWHVNV